MTVWIKKIVVLRPGALGDIVVARGLVRFLKDAFPAARLTLVAPGDRARLFRRCGWVDAVADWDSSVFSWLFSGFAQPPPDALCDIFRDADVLFSYVASGETEAGARLREALALVAPGAPASLQPARPEQGSGTLIGAWMVDGAVAFMKKNGLSMPTGAIDGNDYASAKISVQALRNVDWPGGYAVLHPGSGSVAKNWPLERYAELGRRILAHTALGLVVTAGEADRERLDGRLPGAVFFHQPPLEELAGILAGARVYIGNDSGVSHLAAAVADSAGAGPAVFALFGPSDAAVWAPPGARVISAGKDMNSLSVDAVWHTIVADAVL